MDEEQEDAVPPPPPPASALPLRGDGVVAAPQESLRPLPGDMSCSSRESSSAVTAVATEGSAEISCGPVGRGPRGGSKRGQR